jgi:hypothetical protein
MMNGNGHEVRLTGIVERDVQEGRSGLSNQFLRFNLSFIQIKFRKKWSWK